MRTRRKTLPANSIKSTLIPAYITIRKWSRKSLSWKILNDIRTVGINE